MSTSTAPTVNPATTSNDRDRDALWHIFCPCMKDLPDPEQTAWCGKRVEGTWRTVNRNTVVPMKLCVVCQGLEHGTTPCPRCGQTPGDTK